MSTYTAIDLRHRKHFGPVSNADWAAFGYVRYGIRSRVQSTYWALITNRIPTVPIEVTTNVRNKPRTQPVYENALGMARMPVPRAPFTKCVNVARLLSSEHSYELLENVSFDGNRIERVVYPTVDSSLIRLSCGSYACCCDNVLADAFAGICTSPAIDDIAALVPARNGKGSISMLGSQLDAMNEPQKRNDTRIMALSNCPVLTLDENRIVTDRATKTYCSFLADFEATHSATRPIRAIPRKF